MNANLALQTAPVIPRSVDTLAALWTRAAVQFAHRPAVRSDGDELTYESLDLRARALAEDLAHEGLGPGEICGLYLERSLDCVVSILAVTLTGAAWLPLDPGYPAERLRLMANDAGIRHLITDRDSGVLNLDQPPRVHEPRPPGDVLPLQSKLGSESSARTSDLAYVIYTSGLALRIGEVSNV